MRRAVLLAASLASLGPLALAEEARMTPVPTLDLQRYAGVWYEIARLPFPFQTKCVHLDPEPHPPDAGVALRRDTRAGRPLLRRLADRAD